MKAAQFTRPVVLSHRDPNGTCGSGLGAYVVLNKDGWCLTAAHIIAQRENMSKAKAEYEAVAKDLEALKNDMRMPSKQKKKRLAELVGGRVLLTNFSEWWGVNHVRMVEANILPVVDLALIKLAPFHPPNEYPTLKKPGSGITPGRSLCKLGYPFHTITPEFRDRTFHFPKGAVPPPLFPIEGMFTREVNVQVEPEPGKKITLPSYPLKFLETSTPGLKGQSGGPWFDSRGSVWAIQSQTQHLALGFRPSVQEGAKKQEEHQFLNVGWGVHTETICGALREFKIDFNMSDY